MITPVCSSAILIRQLRRGFSLSATLLGHSSGRWIFICDRIAFELLRRFDVILPVPPRDV